MNTIQNQAQISYISSDSTNTVRTPEVNTTIVDPNIHVVKSCCVQSAHREDIIRYTVSVINSGDIATDGNVLIQDFLDKAGSHVANSAVVYRNSRPLTIAASLGTITRSSYWFENTPEGIPSVTITSLIPGDVIIITYSVLIDAGTPLINNELHNTATATYNLNTQAITQRSDICTVNVNYSNLLANKRGRSQGHDYSNLFYALELTNEGTSAASNIVITESFPMSFQPNSGYVDVKNDIAIVNFMRYANTIENVITKAEAQKTIAETLYEGLNANYYRLKAQLQDVLAKIAQLSSLATDAQQKLINDTTTALLPDLTNSQTLADTAYATLFEPTGPDSGYECVYSAIQTLATAVQTATTNATTTILPDNKDQRASFVCDAHGGGITLLDLCDLTNDAVTMAAVVNRYIVAIASYLRRQFIILGMDIMTLYETNFKAIDKIFNESQVKLNLCTETKDIVIADTRANEALMDSIMNLAFSDTSPIKELSVNFTVTVDQSTNKMTLSLDGLQISPQITVGSLVRSGHIDIYLNGHIEMDKF